MKHSVLVKRCVNVRIDNVDTPTHAKAIEAVDKLNFATIIRTLGRQIDSDATDTSSMAVQYVEDGDETCCYLVDEDGDDEFLNSVWYGSDGKTPLHPGNLCAECLRHKGPSLLQKIVRGLFRKPLQRSTF